MKGSGKGRAFAMAVTLCIVASSASGLFGENLSNLLPAPVKAKGQITIGINGIYPPMEFKNPGSDKLIGFDVDLATALGQALGVKVVYDDQKFDQLINSIITGRVDFVISGMSDTAKRRATLDFVDYFLSGTVCYTTKAMASTYTSLESLSGKTLAVSASTDYYTTMQQWSKDNLESKGKAAIKMLGVDSEATARLQMVQGRAQASAISPEVLGWLAKQEPGQFIGFGPILNPDPYGMAFKKDNAQLRDAVFAAFKQLIADGTYQKLLAKWELSRSAVPQALINGEKK